MKQVLFIALALIFVITNINAQEKESIKIIKVFTSIDIGYNSNYITVSVREQCNIPFADDPNDRDCRRIMIAHIDSVESDAIIDFSGIMQRFDASDLNGFSVNDVTEFDYHRKILFVFLDYSKEVIKYHSQYGTPIGRKYLAFKLDEKKGSFGKFIPVIL